MLNTNLSTRPFYNERAVHLGLLLVTALVVLVTAYNVNQIVTLSAQHTVLAAAADQAEARAQALRSTAARVRGSIDQAALARVGADAREANGLIARRTFSWTELFNRFEATLPPQVRITAVQPKVDRHGAVTLDFAVIAHSVDDVNTFMNRLEATGAFKGLLSRDEHLTNEGLLQANLESEYVPGDATARPAGGGPAARAEKGPARR